MPAHVSFDKATMTCTKQFFHPVGAYSFLPREIAARRIFSGASWMTPIIRSDHESIIMPLYREKDRIWRVAHSSTAAERTELALQVINALHDLWHQGYVHGDIQSPNVFVVEGQVKLLDFELFEAYSDGRPDFEYSFDVIGNPTGLFTSTSWPSEARLVHYYSVNMRGGIGQVLDVPVSRALQIFSGHNRTL